MDYVKDVFLPAVVDGHRQRLQAITSLGAVNVQAAKLLLHFCCFTRLDYVLGLVPLDLARNSLAVAQHDLLAAWCSVLRVDPAELDSCGVREQAFLPHCWGGQGLVDHAQLADAALLGCWAAHAEWLRSTVPSLAGLGRVPPCWGFLPGVCDRLRQQESAAALLPPHLSDFLLSAVPRLRRSLAAVQSHAAFLALHRRLMGDGRRAAAARLLSCSGQGALAWHTTVPWASHLLLSDDGVRLACRFELGLPLPQLHEAARLGAHCACCGLPATDVLGDHVLNVVQPKATTRVFGGGYSTHQGVLSALSRCFAEVRCGVTTDVGGLTGDLRVDLAVRGGASLRPERAGVLVDVSLTHPLTARGELKLPACADRVSVAGDQREAVKVKKYEQLALHSGFDFEPMVFETFGAPGERSLRFLKEAARAFSRPSFPSSPSPSESSPDSLVAFLGSEDYDDFGRSLPGGLLRRWFQQLSVARVASVAKRLQGACVDSVTNPPPRQTFVPTATGAGSAPGVGQSS